jgi:hypothetical protein
VKVDTYIISTCLTTQLTYYSIKYAPIAIRTTIRVGPVRNSDKGFLFFFRWINQFTFAMSSSCCRNLVLKQTVFTNTSRTYRFQIRCTCVTDVQVVRSIECAWSQIILNCPTKTVISSLSETQQWRSTVIIVTSHSVSDLRWR